MYIYQKSFGKVIAVDANITDSELKEIVEEWTARKELLGRTPSEAICLHFQWRAIMLEEEKEKAKLNLAKDYGMYYEE